MSWPEPWLWMVSRAARAIISIASGRPVVAFMAGACRSRGGQRDLFELRRTQ